MYSTLEEVILRNPSQILISNTKIYVINNITLLLDAYLHDAAKIRMVNLIPCTSLKSYNPLILIYNFEKKFYTCSGWC